VTLIIAVATGDGLVLAGDSRTTQSLVDKPWRVLSDFTHKVFEIGRCAVATSGWAFLESRNVAAHMSDFEQQFDPQGKNPETLATELSVYFEALLDSHIRAGIDPAPGPGVIVLSLYVAGYNNGVGELWEILLPGTPINRRFTTETGGALWQGQIDVVGRLIKGIDPALGQRVESDPQLSAALTSLQTSIDGLEYTLNLQLMNIQDAIDFSVLLIRTTMDVQRLTNGTTADPGVFPGVGGPIEIALVTAKNGFEWVQRTSLLAERPSGQAERL
jgi:hypothetical protein